MSDAPHRHPFRHRLAIALAWLALAWEAAWPRLWPPVAVALIFVILALFDLPALLPWWAHWLVLAGFAGATLFLLGRGWRRIRWPGRGRSARRVELASNWRHRPLTGADDQQMAGTTDSGSRALWQTYRDDLGRRRNGLRVGWPHPSIAMPDRFGLRPMLVLTLFIALVVSGGDRMDRLAFALSPGTGAAATSVPVALDLFLMPPDYTRLPPLYRTGAVDEADLTGPVGSVLMARVSGVRSSPEMRLGAQSFAFSALGADGYEVEALPRDSGQVSIEAGGTELGSWFLTLTPDNPPEISFAEPPEATSRWATRIAWQGEDEFGITAIRLHIELAETALEILNREPEVFILSEPLRPPTETDGIAFQDLTPHRWAGLPVVMRLEADDGAGQTGHSAEVEMTLPERVFTHPVAQAIIDQRRRLMRDVTQAGFVAEILQDLSLRPNRFGHDIVVFMALRTAARRLEWSDDVTASAEPIVALLWETALRLEDGDLSLALDRLRDAQQALQEALEGDASDEEIAQLMEDLRAAMDAYMEAMGQDLMERLESGELGELQFGDPQQMIDRSQLDEMLNQIEELGQSGAREEASELLSQLQQMMENLQLGMQMAQPGQQSQGLEMLEDLQALTQAQQQLLDQTFQQATRTPRGEPGDQQFSREAGQVQEALRRQLGDTMRRLGEMMGDIPGELGRAELSMRDAERALGQGAPRRATDPQMEALDQLQQGMQGFAEQLMEQMAQQGQGVQPGQVLPQRGQGEDPLGRRVDGDGGISTDGMDLPPASAVDRARGILDELRRRAGERQRPQDELDYIDRLLRRF